MLQLIHIVVFGCLLFAPAKTMMYERGYLVQIKISVIGHFAVGKAAFDGQTIKTKIITEELQQKFGKKYVYIIDTYGGRKTLLKAPFQVISTFRHGDNVFIFPAHNGLRVYVPLLSFFRKFLKNKKLHYVVIGGWLPEFLLKRKFLSKMLKRFDGIYVETSIMKKALELQGFSNVLVMPNCKNLTLLDKKDLFYSVDKPFKLCTFSRVMKEKGIETAIQTVKKVNERLGYTAYSLDIYGQVDVNQFEWFERLQTEFPDYVHYCGCVDSDKSVDVLKNYFALLFPTHFYTEGIPGTIIDAYAAGVPVISAKWESYSDVVDEGVTGIGYDFADVEQFAQLLLNIAENPNTLLEMKYSCIEKAENFIPANAIRVLLDAIQ